MGTSDGPETLDLAEVVEYLRRRTGMYRELCARQDWESLRQAVGMRAEEAGWARLRQLLTAGPDSATAEPTRKALENLYAERLELETALGEQKASTLSALLALQRSRQLLGQATGERRRGLGRRFDACG